MFKNKFKDELNQIKPDAELKANILKQLKNSTQNQNIKMNSSPQKSYASRFIPAAAIMLAVCIIGVSVWGVGISKPPVQGSPTVEGTAAVPATTTYSAIYNLFEEIYETQVPKQSIWGKIKGFATKGKDVVLYATDNYFVEESIEESVDADGATAVQNKENTSTGTVNKDYSQTNKQVAEVDEADMVKTDGEYIYILNKNDGTVEITKANDGELEKTFTLQTGMDMRLKNSDTQALDMYISDNRLIVIGAQYLNNVNGEFGQRTKAMIYDIANPENPQKANEFAQSGYYISSRLYNGVLYLFSNQTYYQKPEKNDIATYVPTLYDGDKKCPVSEDDIYIFDGEVDRQYLIACSIDINKGERIDSKTSLGGGDTIYVNTKSVYAAAADCTASYEKDSDTVEKYLDSTRLIKFSIENGKFTSAVEGSVRGNILNQFSMDEYDGYFRIVTTVSGAVKEKADENEESEIIESDIAVSRTNDTSVADTVSFTTLPTTNALFVLDKNLKVVGQIVNLAPDERVYSVRFMGKYGYFVTFRQVDPLFAVDLSNPTAPKVLSALKIPGFSNYLHPYGDGLLLGVGKNADENTGRVGKVKLSMFDISNPLDVTEHDKTTLDCSYTQIDNTHKAALIDHDKNIIAFMGSDAYYIYGYTKEDGFKEKAKLSVDWVYSYDVRGLYIGDYFYICTASGIDSYHLDSFEAVDSIIFN